MFDRRAYNSRQQAAIGKIDRRLADLERNAASARNDYILAREMKDLGSDCGTFDARTWQAREFNDLTDPSGIAEVASGYVIVPAGRYRVFASAPAIEVGTHRIRLWDATRKQLLLLGSSEEATLAGHSSRSELRGMIVLSQKTKLALQHYGQNGVEKYGKGKGDDDSATSASYSVVELTRVG